jgi:hypothetical protein
MAAAAHPDEANDVAVLLAGGWTFIDPGEAAGTPEAYRNFIRGSRAEIGITKSGYVVSRSGWFSDRSACYLASGKPVLVQDTGIGDVLPTGRGLVTFNTLEEAADGAHSIVADYKMHSRAARQIAEEFLNSDKVLGDLIEKLVN